jgi:hypothetical protein
VYFNGTSFCSFVKTSNNTTKSFSSQKRHKDFREKKEEKYEGALLVMGMTIVVFVLREVMDWYLHQHPPLPHWQLMEGL